MEHAQPPAGQTLLTLRILFSALIAGVVTFAAVLVFVLQPEPGDGDPGVFLAALFLLAVALVVAWFVVGGLLRRGVTARVAEVSHDEAPGVVHRGFFSCSLVGGAMAEAYCLFALVVYMVTASQPALYAAAAGLLALVVQLPSADRFQRFAEEVHGHRPS